ncbi:MAG TPA: hypothetical protein VMT53_09505 [Terriglobales bacterium]|nr:hypothetical protein [Terriglobales bacterium]
MDPITPKKMEVTPDQPRPEENAYENERAQVERDDDIREKTHDKTLADSFPTSDPPSSIPDPVAAHRDRSQAEFDKLVADLPPGSWIVISEDERRVIGTGATREEALLSAGGNSQGTRVVRVPPDPDAPEQAA